MQPLALKALLKTKHFSLHSTIYVERGIRYFYRVNLLGWCWVTSIIFDEGVLKLGNDRKILMIMFTLVLVILVGCENSSSELSANSNNESSNNTSAQGTDDNLSNKDLTDVQKDTTENSSVDAEKSNNNNAEKVDTDSNKANKTEDTSKNVPVKDEDPSTNNTNSILKQEYLKKLNITKNKVEELEASDSSTFALKKVENDRWEIWDELLNEIYGVLKEQLPPDEMERLREEQRNWINYRDDSALAASQEYKGGTQEHLEYVSVLANLTEERCYELVNNYMK